MLDYPESPLANVQQTQVEESSDEEAAPTQLEDGNEDTLLDEQENAQVEDLNLDQLIKKLVRLALASEYARLPIRRADIASKGTLVC